MTCCPIGQPFPPCQIGLLLLLVGLRRTSDRVTGPGHWSVSRLSPEWTGKAQQVPFYFTTKCSMWGLGSPPLEILVALVKTSQIMLFIDLMFGRMDHKTFSQTGDRLLNKTALLVWFVVMYFGKHSVSTSKQKLQIRALRQRNKAKLT